MEKILITGLSGFVAKHFLDYLENSHIRIQVLGLDIQPISIVSDFKYIDFSYACVDLLQEEDIERILFQFQPEYILHLASYSSVAFSWKNPILSFQNNVNIFLNLLEVIRKYSLGTRILSIGSSEEYGNINTSDIPLKEISRLDPLSPYAVARVSQEMLSRLYANSYNQDIVMTRSFNHIGPGQSDVFVVSSFVRRALEAKLAGEQNIKLTVGNIDIIRDFLDVRDVVEAYYKLLHYGKKGEVYNVCSGRAVCLSEVLAIIADLLEVQITPIVDKNFIRPNDNMLIVGDSSKLREDTDWYPKYSLKESINDIIQYWKSKID